jgi:RNA polymerase sigma-70 factor (ECF subfamily)
VPHAALSNILRRLRGAAAASAGAPDAELLERFAASGDESAFELLLWRHGPMVLGVCRRVLRHEQDAEDAFQATFLALAKKAGSVTRRGSVGGWLYRVARRVALDARERAERRAGRERAVGVVEAAGSADPAAEAAGRELWRALDEELGRLPERCRAAFVLRCLEGRSGPEAARELGCAVVAVESRLARARGRLRARLACRGLLPSAGLTAAALVPRASGAGVPPHLIVAALRAVALTAGRGAAGAAVSANVLALTQGVLRTMFLTKLKLVGTLLLAAGFVGAGAGGLGYRSWAAEGPGDGGAAQAQPRPGEGPLLPGGPQRADPNLFDPQRDDAQNKLRGRVVDPTAGLGDALQQLQAVTEQQQALAAQLERLARQFQDLEARGRLPQAQNKLPWARPGGSPAGLGTRTTSQAMFGGVAVTFRTAEQQRRLDLLDRIRETLAELKASVPEGDTSRRSVEAVEVDVRRVWDQLAQAGLLGPASGRALGGQEAERGSVREVTPGGFAVLDVRGDVRPEQTFNVIRSEGNSISAVGQVTVVAVNGKEAVARVLSGRPQRGDRVLEPRSGQRLGPGTPARP